MGRDEVALEFPVMRVLKHGV